MPSRSCFFHLTDLDGVDLEGPRQLRKGLGLLGGFQGDPALKAAECRFFCRS